MINNLNVPFNGKMLVPHGEWYQLIATTPTVILAFTFQFNAFPIYYSLKEPTPENMMKATYLGVIFCAFVYIIAGIVGYLTYGDAMESSILWSLLGDLKIYHESDQLLLALLLLVSASFLVSSTMSIPLMFIGLKKNFINTVIFCKKKFFAAQELTHDNNKITEKLIDHEDSNSHENLKFADSNINTVKENNDSERHSGRKVSENNVSTMSKKSKKELAEKIESKYVTEKEKNIIIICLFIAIIGMTILIKLLSTVSIQF